VRAFISWLYSFALSLGGPGLFTVAFLDSSFISLPQINDILVVLMVTEHKAWMVYFAFMATTGSVAGCYVIYYLAKKGGEAFVRKRLKPGHVAVARGLRYLALGILAIYYGDAALELMRTHGSTVAIVLATLLVAVGILLWLRTRKPVVGSP
jgi:membrane protein DedA with SNARE-associated domain